MSTKNNEMETKVPETESAKTEQEETKAPEVKGKDLKILGMKVHVEKAEKKAKEPKDPEQKPDKKKKVGKTIAGIGGGLVVVGVVAKGVLDTVARRNAYQQVTCQGEDPYSNAQDGVFTEVDQANQDDSEVGKAES